MRLRSTISNYYPDNIVVTNYLTLSHCYLQVVNTLSDAFAACTIESPKDMEISSNSIAAVVSSPDHIARDAQVGYLRGRRILSVTVLLIKSNR